jgi:hypothetical protein
MRHEIRADSFDLDGFSPGISLFSNAVLHGMASYRLSADGGNDSDGRVANRILAADLLPRWRF